MFPTFGLVVRAVLLVGGLWWCKEMYARFPKDLACLRESEDRTEKGVTIFLWVVTGVVAILVVSFVVGLVQGVMSAF